MCGKQNGLEDRRHSHLQMLRLAATERVSDGGEDSRTAMWRKSVRSAEPGKAAAEWC